MCLVSRASRPSKPPWAMSPTPFFGSPRSLVSAPEQVRARWLRRCVCRMRKPSGCTTPRCRPRPSFLRWMRNGARVHLPVRRGCLSRRRPAGVGLVVTPRRIVRDGKVAWRWPTGGRRPCFPFGEQTFYRAAWRKARRSAASCAPSKTGGSQRIFQETSICSPARCRTSSRQAGRLGSGQPAAAEIGSKAVRQ